jgi:signal peptidase I
MNDKNILGEMWQEACSRGNVVNFRIISNSMSPVINAGDIVRVSKIEHTALKTGDIVACRDGRNIVVHRIIGKHIIDGQRVIRHRGDAGVGSGLIPVENLIGKVVIIKKDDDEIYLDTLWHLIRNRVLGYRLRIKDSIDRIPLRPFSVILHRLLRPIWQLFRRIFF